MIREYTIAIETPEGTTTDEEVTGRFHEAILSTQALGPSALLDHERGVIGSRFQVEADTVDTAQRIGISVFVRALRSAGVTTVQHYEIVEASEGPIVG